MEKEFIVYKHTSPSNKVYIGITSQLPCQRWANGQGYRGNWHFENAIKSYGWNNFKHEVLFEHLSEEEAKKIEIELIAKYDSTNPEYGYNRSLGGDNVAKFSDESRKKMSESAKRRGAVVKGEKHPQYGKRGILNQNYGRKHSDEERKLMSANNTRKKIVICVETNEIFESAVKAAEKYNTYGGAINACCNHKIHYNTAGGFHWRYADE